MQLIIDEIVNKVRAVDKESVLSPETMGQIVAACLHAVREVKAHAERTREERSVAGPWSLQEDEESWMPPVAMVQLIAVDTKGMPLGGDYKAFSAAYNPTELTFEKQMQFAEISIPGLDAPLQQFVRGNAEKLNVELFFDTTEQGMGIGATSVTTLTDQVFQLMRIDPDRHAPPIVKFIWNSHIAGDALPASKLSTQKRDSFICVIESIRQKFNLFSPEGIPLRATLTLVLREYRSLEKQMLELHLNSPDKTHSHVLAGGETLTAVANAEWQRPDQWRAIADANQLEDPRRLRVGTFLTIPVLAPG